jgi:hypothetical protein
VGEAPLGDLRPAWDEQKLSLVGEGVWPVLQAVHQAQSARPNQIDVSQSQVNEQLGREPDSSETDRTLLYLAEAGYIESTVTVDQLFGPMHMHLTEKGLQATAGWPSTQADAIVASLIAAFDERIEAAETDEERTKLAKARDALLGLVREVLADVIANQMARYTG